MRWFVLALSITSALADIKCCHDPEEYDPAIVCYNDDFPFDNMPLPGCMDSIQVSMRVYTRNNRDSGQVITRTTVPPAWNPNLRTHFLVHGWLGSRHNNWLHNMKDKALDREDYNMVVVGWEGGSQQLWYPQSASETRVVGTEIALVIQNLVDWYGGDLDNFYCAGHSLGSHVCGHAGKRVRGGMLGRITGMDPAGPWFEGKDSPLVGLDRSDAQLVDVMHTNGEAGIILNLGTMKRLGHLDFYPNGGGTQPGCILDPYRWNKTYTGAVPTEDMFVDLMPACSHMRVLDLYLESIDSRCMFYSDMSCPNTDNMPNNCAYLGPTPQVSMGFDAQDYWDESKDGIWYLTTNNRDPYCPEYP